MTKVTVAITGTSFTKFCLILCGLVLSIHSKTSAQAEDLTQGWVSIENFIGEETLSIGDTISILIAKVPDLSGEYSIDSNGMINLPLIGNIEAVNQTPASLAVKLEVLYEADYLVNPRITVKIFSKRLADKIITLPAETIVEPIIITPNYTDPVTSEDIVLPSSSTELSGRATEPPIIPEMPLTSELVPQIATLPSLEPKPIEPIPSDNSNIVLETVVTSSPPISGRSESFQNAFKPQKIDLGGVSNDAMNIINSLQGTAWSVQSPQREFIQFLSNGDIAGAIGCNNFFAQYLESESKLDIRLIGSTYIECEGNTKLGEFFDILESTTGYQLIAGDLHLLDEHNEIILALQQNN